MVRTGTVEGNYIRTLESAQRYGMLKARVIPKANWRFRDRAMGSEIIK